MEHYGWKLKIQNYLSKKRKIPSYKENTLGHRKAFEVLLGVWLDYTGQRKIITRLNFKVTHFLNVGYTG